MALIYDWFIKRGKSLWKTKIVRNKKFLQFFLGILGFFSKFSGISGLKKLDRDEFF